MNSNILNEFYRELKKYNLTNYRTLKEADLKSSNPIVHKSFSSVVTRYFIFCEHHPELSDTEKKMLYYMAKIDMIAQYFSEYPESNIDYLRQFQSGLRENLITER